MTNRFSKLLNWKVVSSKQLFEYCSYLALAIPIVALTLLCYIGNFPQWSPEQFRNTLSSFNPLIGSVATISGAIVLWLWSSREREIQEGLKNFGFGQDQLFGLTGDINTATDRASLKRTVREDLFTLMKAMQRLSQYAGRISRGWEYSTKAHELDQELKIFYRAHSEIHTKLGVFWGEPTWAKIDIQILSATRHVSVGFVHFFLADRYKTLEKRVMLSVVLAITTSVLFVVVPTLPIYEAPTEPARWVPYGIAFALWLGTVSVILPLAHIFFWRIEQNAVDIAGQTFLASTTSNDYDESKQSTPSK